MNFNVFFLVAMILSFSSQILWAQIRIDLPEAFINSEMSSFNQEIYIDEEYIAGFEDSDPEAISMDNQAQWETDELSEELKFNQLINAKDVP